RVVATAYRALQRLRAQEWEKLLAQKIVGSGSSEPDGRIDQHLRLQRRLVFVRDQLLLQSGGLTAELRAEATRLSRQVPELACELSPESVSRALDRLREELDEMMRRKAEAGASIAPPPRPAIPGEDHVKVPEGCAVVEYFKTPERACAFVLKGGCDRIRYLPLEVIEIPKLEQLSGELVRSVRDLGRLPAPPAPELPAGLARFESALQTIARAYWPAPLHELLADCRRIYVVPWDDLWRIPFAALPTPAGEPLVRDRTLALLPSIHSLENLSFRPPTIPQDQISVLAYDSTRGSPNALTNMEAEVELLRRRLPRARIVEKDEASPGAALSLVEASRWLHVACHGHTDQDAVMFSRLALAADREHPDGSWYLYELEGFHEGLEGVFLNACDSNLGDMVGDRPETLAFAFLSAGAQAVVGTLGKIFDDVALELVRLFYGQLGSLRPEEALSLCLQQLIGSDPARTV
ncbi:MAG: CHAT domain-containing protein, partial [bacterium]|nr:CHAT domain-containing protein [bacterium]